jgi:hypothetical protein
VSKASQDPPQDHIEAISLLILELGARVSTKADFLSAIQRKFFQQYGITPSPSWLNHQILYLRLIGLLKRKYYQTSVLGQFFLAYRLDLKSFFELFEQHGASILKRSPSQKVSSKQFAVIYLLSAEWYFGVLKSRSLEGPDIDDFLLILSFAFEWSTNFPADLAKKVQHILDEFRKRQYRKRLVEEGSHVLARYKSLDATKQKKSILPKSRQVNRGEVLKRVIEDIYIWMIEVSQEVRRRLQSNDPMILRPVSWMRPYFDVRKHAKILARSPLAIQEANYTRAVYWIMTNNPNRRRVNKFLRSLGLLESRNEPISDIITKIQKKFQLVHLVVEPNKPQLVLLYTPLVPFYQWYLKQTCETCSYFESHRGVDCVFFQRLDLLQTFRVSKVPPHLEPLIKTRTKLIFKEKVACPFWRSEKPILLTLPNSPNGSKLCVHCLQHLPKLPSSRQPVVCHTCETEYRVSSYPLAQQGKFEVHLTQRHSIGHDLALINPLYKTHAEDPVGIHESSSLAPSQFFDPQRDFDEGILTDLPGYLYIEEQATLSYEKSYLQVGRGNKFHLLTEITLIDSCKWDMELEDILRDFPHIKFNLRSMDVTLSRDTNAWIINPHSRFPILCVKPHFKKSVYKYPLFQLKAVYNVGKPRLTKFLKQWGVKVLFSSTKGIHSRPEDSLKTAIELPAVRETLRKMHLKCLFLSLSYATVFLADIADQQNQTQLGNNLRNRLEKLFQRRSLLFDERLTHFLTYKQAGLLEAWVARPFAEGIRHLVSLRGGSNQSLISRSYGRTKARRIKKKDKRGSEFLGGYTPFDAALNTVNRHLRYLLRKQNAKHGLGFKTFPLFAHTSKDKSGRAGHLDLEEVGRIISRLVLVESIMKGEFLRSHFRVQYDDDYIPYYVPSWRTQIRLRKNLVRDRILTTDIFYGRKWLSFEKAHNQHVQHLCNCLKECLSLETEPERVRYLTQTYQPLIFHPHRPIPRLV